MTVLLDVQHSEARQCSPGITIRWTGQGDQKRTLEWRDAYRPEQGRAIDLAWTGRQQLDQDIDSGVNLLWNAAYNRPGNIVWNEGYDKKENYGENYCSTASGADKTDITDRRAVVWAGEFKRIDDIGIDGYLREYDSS